MAEKLDGVMLVVFTYLDQRLTAHASLPPEKILETPLLPLIHGAATAEGGVEDGEAGADGSGSSSSNKGRRSSMGGSQGMEPVARLLKVHFCLVASHTPPPSRLVSFLPRFATFRESGRAEQGASLVGEVTVC